MRIYLEHDGNVFEYESRPMEPERFAVVCKLVWSAIGGLVLLGAVHMVGALAIGGAVVAQVFYGLYKMA